MSHTQSPPVGTGIQPACVGMKPPPQRTLTQCGRCLLCQATPPWVTSLSLLALDVPGFQARSPASQNLPRPRPTGGAGHPSGEASRSLDESETGNDSSRDTGRHALSLITENEAAVPSRRSCDSALLQWPLTASPTRRLPTSSKLRPGRQFITLHVPREATDVSPTLHVVHF